MGLEIKGLIFLPNSDQGKEAKHDIRDIIPGDLDILDNNPMNRTSDITLEVAHGPDDGDKLG